MFVQFSPKKKQKTTNYTIEKMKRQALPGDGTLAKQPFTKKHIIDLTQSVINGIVWLSSPTNDSWDQTDTNPRNILVIGDEAGTYKNKKVYDALEAEGYVVDIISTDDQAVSFLYPKNWQQGKFKDNKNDLAGFGHTVGERCLAKTPSLIICGSRGSQITLAVVMRYYWRGPFIAMNGGPLTSNTPLSSLCSPCFLTFDQDYFPTHDTSFSLRKYDELAEQKGQRALLVHVMDEAHMPRASTLFPILTQLIPLVIHKAGQKRIQALMWPETVSIFQLQKDNDTLKFWG